MRTQYKDITDSAQLKVADYAAEQDFCKIFHAEMQSFYQLALMLTGSHTKAEQSFSAALSDCLRATGTFKAWALSRSRLAVIERAIKNAEPALREVPAGVSKQMEAILRLDVFDRFVYVLTVLETYSVRDCAILLRRRVTEINAARLRVMAAIAAPATQVLAPINNLLLAPLSA
jgi:hypothetical protein